MSGKRYLLDTNALVALMAGVIASAFINKAVVVTNDAHIHKALTANDLVVAKAF